MPGGNPSPGRQNQTLPTGTSVTTAAGGRATLDNGDQRIVVAPNSRLTVQPDAGGFTRIAQDLGAAMFKVDKKVAPHFRVETPLLAAIVQGTTFTVMVEAASDAVSVAEGLVEVRSNLNAVGSDVAAGATGTVMRDSPSTVQVVTPASAPAGPALAPVNIAPIDYKAASDGLIDVAPAVSQAGQNAPGVRATVAGSSNNTVGGSVQDGASIVTGGSVGAAVSQIASVEAAQRGTSTQVAATAGVNNGNTSLALGVSGAGNGGSMTVASSGGSSGNANGSFGTGDGSGLVTTVAAPVITPVVDITGGVTGGVNGNGSGFVETVVAPVVTPVVDVTGGLAGAVNGNGGDVLGAVVTPVVTTAVDITGGLTGAVEGSGSSGTANSGSNLVPPVIGNVTAPFTGLLGY